MKLGIGLAITDVTSRGNGGASASNPYFTNDTNTNAYFTDDAFANKFVTSGGDLWSPMTLDNKIMYYDAREESGVDYYTTFSNFASSVKLKTFINLFNRGTYDTTSPNLTASVQMDARGINGNYTFRGGDNAYSKTGYMPNSGAKSVVARVKMTTVGGTMKSFWGCNDGVNRRFFAGQTGTGAIIVGHGTASFTTTKIYSEGDILDIVIIFNGTNLNVWINGINEIVNQATSFTGTSTNEVLLMARTASGSPTEYFNGGHLGVIFVTDDALTNEERLAAQLWLNTGWIDNKIYVVFGLKGQSNTSGVVSGGADYSTTERPIYRIQQIDRSGDSFDKTVMIAYEPLKHWASEPNAIAFGFAFAKAFLARQTDSRVNVLLVPGALGDTGYTAANLATPGRWIIGGDLHEDLILRSNIAMSTNGNTSWGGLLEIMGERDTVNGMAQATFANFTDATFADLKSRITGASNSPYICSGLVPDFFGVGMKSPVELAIQDMPNRIARGGYINTDDLAGMTPDDLHYNAPAQRIIGPRIDAKLITL